MLPQRNTAIFIFTYLFFALRRRYIVRSSAGLCESIQPKGGILYHEDGRRKRNPGAELEWAQWYEVVRRNRQREYDELVG